MVSICIPMVQQDKQVNKKTFFKLSNEVPVRDLYLGTPPSFEEFKIGISFIAYCSDIRNESCLVICENW